jgi:hypothetical protein
MELFVLIEVRPLHEMSISSPRYYERLCYSDDENFPV